MKKRDTIIGWVFSLGGVVLGVFVACVVLGITPTELAKGFISHPMSIVWTIVIVVVVYVIMSALKGYWLIFGHPKDKGKNPSGNKK